MKFIATGGGLFAVFAAFPALAESTQISRNVSRGSFVGPQKFFTGTAIVDRLFEAHEHTPTTGGGVTFAPGARSAWHTHPAAQHLIVITAGATSTSAILRSTCSPS